jgi:two-component system, sensor histidine kinase and response regulator
MTRRARPGRAVVARITHRRTAERDLTIASLDGPHAGSRIAAVAAAMPATQQPVSILLVDDKPENLVALEELLRQPDRRLVRASSGNEALRLLLKHDFAVVLLDVEMPEMDGYETAQLMRSVERTRAIPIVFVTAGDRSEERTFRGYEAGAVDFLYKPIDAHILKAKVGVFVELYRKTRDLAAVNAALEETSLLLRDKIAELENVSHTLSHDLRAPVRSIRSFAQILSESLHGALDAEQADALDRVVRSSARISSMIDELFELLRVGASEAPRSDVDIAAVLTGIVDDLNTDIARAGARITHDALPTVRTNRMLVSQILQNLISNALKFRGDGEPAVHITAARRSDAWELAVHDNGIGIRPEDHERVFKLFQRVNGAAGGAGVGLALCKRAVEKLGGRIWVVSEGTGTAFHFTLCDEPSR